MNPNNTIINKFFPDNQVITEWSDKQQWKYVELWSLKNGRRNRI